MRMQSSSLKQITIRLLLCLLVWSSAAVSARPSRESNAVLSLGHIALSDSCGKIEITIRNAGKAPISYSIKSFQSYIKPNPKILSPGEIHRIPGNQTLDIKFRQGNKNITYQLNPGESYSFRYNERAEWELYEGSHGRDDAVDLAPYVQTPMLVVEKILSLAHVDQHDMVFDLGCGDGRIIITAAKKYGARGVGIDIIPERIKESRANAKAAGIEDLVEFRLQDATKSDISQATVVTLYLIPESNELLRPLLDQQLKIGTYVISHGYPITGWENKLEDLVSLEVGEEDIHLIYLYRR